MLFQRAGLETFGYGLELKPYTYSLRPFLRGEGRGKPPSLYIDSDPQPL